VIDVKFKNTIKKLKDVEEFIKTISTIAAYPIALIIIVILFLEWYSSKNIQLLYIAALIISVIIYKMPTEKLVKI